MNRYNDQIPLDFDHARARRSDPETSHEAASKVNLAKRKAEVLAALKTFPDGATSYTVAKYMKQGIERISPVFARLKEAGLARESGRYELASETNRRRIIWEVVP